MAKSAAEIRQAFIRYFERHGHKAQKSSSLVPHNDPTLLFTNAGMVQFKDLFTGEERRDDTRVVTSQKCLRAGGKHNDLENVGVTARHHTFFEMLGNFSFGDYFKTDAIRFAWEFITKELGVAESRLCVTVFKGENGVPADEETEKLWAELAGVPRERIFRLGAKDNFWSMGDTGPCGPCSEIHFYQGDLPPQQALKIFNTKAADDQWIEIWNLVFMQFERFADGRLEPLPKPSIDTGMGLERIAAIVNGLTSNYETTLLRPLIDKAAAMCNKKYTSRQNEDDISMRVLADHARATAFLIADGVFPANEGRGYVLRRIMRRAIRHGERLGFGEVFFYKITGEVVAQMGDTYPELTESRTSIEKWVRNEEEGFRRTLRTGLRLLTQRMEKVGAVLPGADAFELYDTYGFPLDLTEVIVREQGKSVDHAGFETALQAQRARAGAFKNEDKGVANLFKEWARDLGATRFLGYELEERTDGNRWVMRARPAAECDYVEIDGEGFVKVKVKAIALAGKSVTSAKGSCDLALDPTPFYGESGGQIGDRHGELANQKGERIARVLNTSKPAEGFTLSTVDAQETLKVGDTLLARYDALQRHETRAHHSATHLLHKALRDTLGDHVKQAGSLVTPERLRFDFSHFEAVSAEQLDAIEAHVNARIAKQAAVQTEVLAYEDAKKKGAVALFGEKYGDNVRVLSIADSMELCGGTHAFNTADIGALRVTKEEAVAAGVRRIEAVVGFAALALDEERARIFASLARVVRGGEVEATQEDVKAYAALQRRIRDAATHLKVEQKAFTTESEATLSTVPPALHRTLLRLSAALRTNKAAQRSEIVKAAGAASTHPLVRALATMLDAWDVLDKRLAEGRSAQLGSVAVGLAKKVRLVAGTKLVAESLDSVDPKELRAYADKVRDALGSGVVALAVVQGDKASVIITVSKDLTARFKAGELIKSVAQSIGGSGGGKPDMAQAGGPNIAALPQALAGIAGMLQ